jgi:DNA-binding GntR family transcriptional regulator
LTSEGLLEVRPGIGTVVAQPPAARAGRSRLVARGVEQLAVEAMQVGLSLDELQDSIAECWRGLHKENGR